MLEARAQSIAPQPNLLAELQGLSVSTDSLSRSYHCCTHRANGNRVEPTCPRTQRPLITCKDLLYPHIPRESHRPVLPTTPWFVDDTRQAYFARRLITATILRIGYAVGLSLLPSSPTDAESLTFRVAGG